MLRHIISFSLVMAACVTLIPTKTNAATLTVRPSGEIQKKPGDLIEFIFDLSPAPSTAVTFLGIGFASDGEELSYWGEGSTILQGSIINTTTTIATRIFGVLAPIKDGMTDMRAIVIYDEFDSSGTPNRFEVFADSGDVVPVPEPLTIFGTATAFGCGVLFKRKSSKKTVS